MVDVTEFFVRDRFLRAEKEDGYLDCDAWTEAEFVAFARAAFERGWRLFAMKEDE